jgi:hypothetical protein
LAEAGLAARGHPVLAFNFAYSQAVVAAWLATRARTQASLGTWE